MSETPFDEEATQEVVVPIREVCVNDLYAPRFVVGKNGPMIFGSDEGNNYKAYNEDRIAVDTGANAFALFDGMGGKDRGDEAAEIAAETALVCFGAERWWPTRILVAAHSDMQGRGIDEGGAAFAVGRIFGDTLEVFCGGDVKVIVVDERGVVVHRTIDQGGAAEVSNVIQGSSCPSLYRYRFKIRPGMRVIAATDGLFDSYSPEQVAAITHGKSIQHAMKDLEEVLREKMITKRGKPDNRSILMYDIEKIEEGTLPSLGLDFILPYKAVIKNADDALIRFRYQNSVTAHDLIELRGYQFNVREAVQELEAMSNLSKEQQPMRLATVIRADQILGEISTELWKHAA